MTAQISAIKLSTGEEFIAATTQLTDGYLEVKDPVTIIQNHKNGQASFSPWFAFSDTRTFTFTSKQVMFCEPAGVEVVNGYKQAFGMIKTPPEKKIII